MLEEEEVVVVVVVAILREGVKGAPRRYNVGVLIAERR